MLNNKRERRCWGRNRNFRRCGRYGPWCFFCTEHRYQWIIWLIFTIGPLVLTCYTGWHQFWRQPETPIPQFSIHPIPYQYSEGLDVEGIIWKDEYKEYMFSVSNLNKKESIVDIRIRYELPWPIIGWKLYEHEGFEEVQIDNYKDTVKSEFGQYVYKLSDYKTNILKISALKIFPEGHLHGKLIFNTEGPKTKHSNIQVDYRHTSRNNNFVKNSLFFNLKLTDNVKDKYNISISLDTSKDKKTRTIIMMLDKPLQLTRRREVKLTIPDSSVGVIYEQSDSVHPIGTGFVLEDKRYVVTAWHIIFDSKTGKERHVLFHPVGENVTQAFDLRPHKLLQEPNLAIMKIDGNIPNTEPLVRGRSDSIRVGDYVAYAGFDNQYNKSKVYVTAGTVLEIPEKGDIRIFKIEGKINSGYAGGPVFEKDNRIIGMISKAQKLENKKTLLYVLDVRNIPSFSP